MSKYYDKVETMSREELTELQSKRLIELVKRVYENVPTYRAKMDAVHIKPEDIRSIADISKLPFTEKQDLRGNYPFGLFATPMKDIVRLHASSGTTGKLTVVGYTKNDLHAWSKVVARALTAAGVTADSIVQVSYGYGLFTGGLGLHYGVEEMGATVVPTSSGNTQRQIMLMKDFKADVLCCTPSYAIYLAEEVKKENLSLDELNLKVGIFGAEPWSEEMRRVIEKSLKIKAFDIYGLSEITGPGVACECEYHDGSHISEDYFYPEIIDPVTGEPLPYGQEGELVFTTLCKEGLPLIRYRTHDITSLNIEPCRCGRTFVRMNRVTGRSDDMLIIRGVNVFPSQIESVLMRNCNVEPYYQIIIDRVNNLDVMEIDVEVNDSMFSDKVKELESLKRALESDLQSNLSVSAKVKLVGSNTLPRSEGKAKRITDNRKI